MRDKNSNRKIKLNNMPYVSESLIVLQKDKLVALIYPDFDDAFAHGMEQSDIEKVMEDNRNELNLQLPAYSQITKVKIQQQMIIQLIGKKKLRSSLKIIQLY